jgi:predicted MPP superfamily phosphohydrolase
VISRRSLLKGGLGSLLAGFGLAGYAFGIEPHVRVPERVSLTLCGHTHGGQVLGYSPVVPSRFGRRYAYGHIIENQRNLIVSGGLGCAILPVRIGVPPEIVLVDVATA